MPKHWISVQIQAFKEFASSRNANDTGAKGKVLIWFALEFLFWWNFSFSARSFLWIVIVGLALYLCGKSVYNVVSEWKENPVKVDIDDKTPSPSAIPFPTVTFCPDVKARVGTFNLTRVRAILNGSKEELTPIEWEFRSQCYSIISWSLNLVIILIFWIRWQRVEALAHICPDLLSDVDSSNKYQFRQKFADESIHDVIQSLSSTLEFEFPFIRGPRRNESGLLEEVWTEEGICYSFNALNSRDVYTDE